MVAILSAFQNAHIVEPLGHEVDARRSDLLIGLGPRLTQKLAGGWDPRKQSSCINRIKFIVPGFEIPRVDGEEDFLVDEGHLLGDIQR